MLEVSEHYAIPESALEEKFIHASGPGGQNVNKVASAVQLRFHLNRSGLPDDWEARFRAKEHKQINEAGEWVIVARRFRSQEQNRVDARLRLVLKLKQCMNPPTKRRATQPSNQAKAQRLETKRKRAELKKSRRKEDWHD